MTRIDKAYFTTICNRKLCSSIALTKEKLHMSLAPRLITGDAAEKVESSLCMWAVRESMPRISNFSEEPGNQKKKYGKLFCYTKTRHGFVRPMCKRKHLKRYRACWESTNRARNRQGLPQKDVGGNITILTSESKTSDWHKQFMWTPPARYVNREGKRLACEKHMDWWPASTKPLLQPYAIQNCSTIALTKERLHMSLAARFLTRDVAQMVEPRFASEVQGSMPRISNFSEELGNQKKEIR